MRQFYYSLLVLGFSFFVSAQGIGDTPVERFKTIKNTDIAKGKTLDNNSGFNGMAQTQSAVTTNGSTGNSAEIGITGGELTVSLSRAVTYDIPIKVRPGINGVVPQVSLIYNSQAGNGIAGCGWNISGISSIVRIPAAKSHDGKLDGLDFDSFALNGQRLVIRDGTVRIYGGNGTVYETENFSSAKITSYGVHPSGVENRPAYFLVEYPDGSKAYYGNSNDSRSITEYAITYWESPQGARISYTYHNDNNSLNISSINYGTLGATIPINKIQFYYDTISRFEGAFVGGQNSSPNKILKSISVTNNGIGFRNYGLSYLVDSQEYIKLSSVTEKSGDNSKSPSSTVFTYGDASQMATSSGSNIVFDVKGTTSTQKNDSDNTSSETIISSYKNYYNPLSYP